MKTDLNAELAAALAELENTKKKLTRTERKLEREKDTSRLWFNALDDTKQRLAQANAALVREDKIIAALDRTIAAQDKTIETLEKTIKTLEKNYNSIITPGTKNNATMPGEPRHRRQWGNFRPRKK